MANVLIFGCHIFTRPLIMAETHGEKNGGEGEKRGDGGGRKGEGKKGEGGVGC